MKPATDIPDASVVETTTRRRVIPVSDANSAEKTIDFWDYVRAIGQRDPAEWQKHMVYVYRVEPQPSVPLLKSGDQYLNMPNGQRVSVADQEELEFALTQSFGGGVFRIIVKKGAQQWVQVRIPINAPVRAITIPAGDAAQPANGNGVTITGMSDSAQIAGKAIDTIAGAEHQAVRIGMEALGAAANVVRSFSDGRPGGGAQDDLTRQLINVMLQRMLQPPPDPLELLARMMTLMQGMNPAAKPNEMMDRVMGAAIDKILNPTPSGPATSATAEFVRQIPALGSTVAEGLREFRMAREAEERMVRLGAQRQPGPPVPQMPQVPAPPAIQLVPPAPAPPAGAPSMEFIDQKIIEILHQPVSAEQAADDAMAFLSALDAKAVHQLSLLGEGGILARFQSRPILKQATNNMPRLVEFIRAFLKMHAEDQAAEAAGQEAPKPTLPN